MSETVDCLVVGGGPAGLMASTYLSRFRRSVLLVDKGWSRAEWIPVSHNLAGFAKGVPGPVLLEDMRAQARRYGARLLAGEVAALARREDGGFRAVVPDGDIFARAVVLATGVIENRPPLPHFADAVKRGLVRTCPVCDGYEAIGKRVAVFGTGEHAASEALFLRTFADDVTLLVNGADADGIGAAVRRSLEAAAVAVNHVMVGAVSLDQDGVVALEVEDGRTHRFDLVYAAFGTTSQSQLATTLGARSDSSGRLIVDAHQQTSVPGLYAAGDVVRGLNQIAVATGEAAIAATAIHNALPKVFA